MRIGVINALLTLGLATFSQNSSANEVPLKLMCKGSGTVTQYMGFKQVDTRDLVEMDFPYEIDLGTSKMKEIKHGSVYPCQIDAQEFVCESTSSWKLPVGSDKLEMTEVLNFKISINRLTGRYSNVTTETVYEGYGPPKPHGQRAQTLYKIFGNCERSSLEKKF